MMTLFQRLRRLIGMLALCGLASLPTQAQPLRIGGTGGALGLMTQLGQAFSGQTTIAVEVVPSLGTGGGLRALVDGALELAVAGRDLTKQEQAAGLQVGMRIETLYVFATLLQHPPSLPSADLAHLFSNPGAMWPDGTPVRVVLRPVNESDHLVMFRLFPGTEAAIASLRRRDDVPMAPTDQDNQRLAAEISGSLIGTTLTQMLTEHPDLRMTPIDGVAPNLETLSDGRYRYRKSLYLIVPRQPTATTRAFLSFIRSEKGQTQMRQYGALPADG